MEYLFQFKKLFLNIPFFFSNKTYIYTQQKLYIERFAVNIIYIYDVYIKIVQFLTGLSNFLLCSFKRSCDAFYKIELLHTYLLILEVVLIQWMIWWYNFKNYFLHVDFLYSFDFFKVEKILSPENYWTPQRIYTPMFSEGTVYLTCFSFVCCLYG